MACTSFTASNLNSPTASLQAVIRFIQYRRANGQLRWFRIPIESGGVFRQQQLIANVNIRPSRIWSVSGYGVINYCQGRYGTINDISRRSTPTTLGRITGGRSSICVTGCFCSATYNLPHTISMSPMMIFSAGTPYNITTGTVNLSGQAKYNDRPMFGPAEQYCPRNCGDEYDCGLRQLCSATGGSRRIHADSDQLLHGTYAVHDECAPYQDFWLWS